MLKQQTGFSLLEIAIVLVLLGLGAGFANQAWRAQIDSKKLQANQQQLAEIKQAMLAHLASFKFLPCPDTSGDGHENRKSNGACDKHHGRLPYLDLQTHAFDQFHQPFFYAVNQNSTSVTTANHLLKACGQASLFGKTGTYENQIFQCTADQQVFCSQAQCTSGCETECQNLSKPQTQPPYFHRISPPLGTSTAGGSLIICGQNAQSCLDKTPKSQLLAAQLPAVVISFGKRGNQIWLQCANGSEKEAFNCNGSRYFQHFPPSEDYQQQLTWLTTFEAKQALAGDIDW